jgi:hypothetical protein
MKTILLFSLLFTFSALHAQSNLSIFNNNGQSFYVVLNGIRQNSKPETNVQVAQIKNGSYAVKVIFADGKTPDIDKNFMIDAPYDITTRIVFKKGKGKLQLMGMEPTQGVIQEAVVYRPTDAAVYSDATTTIQTMPASGSTTIQTTGTGNTAGINMNVNVSETPNTTIQTSNTNTATTTTTTTGTIPDENVNLNMNLSLGGVNVNFNANASATGSGTGLGTGVSVTETTTSSSTTTTTSSSSVLTSTAGSNGTANQGSNQVSANIQLNGNSQVAQNQQNVQQQQQQQQMITQVQQAPLSNRVNCTKTMNRLEAFKVELQDQSFEEDRLEALQLSMKSTCLTTAQAEQLLDLFTFDENRLEVAKYLSDRLTDRDNAGALAKKLTFDSSKMEYRRYISE